MDSNTVCFVFHRFSYEIKPIVDLRNKSIVGLYYLKLMKEGVSPFINLYCVKIIFL